MVKFWYIFVIRAARRMYSNDFGDFSARAKHQFEICGFELHVSVILSDVLSRSQLTQQSRLRT